jgi:hypothetical protein
MQTQRDARNAIHEGQEMESENETYTAHDWKDPVWTEITRDGEHRFIYTQFMM